MTKTVLGISLSLIGLVAPARAAEAHDRGPKPPIEIQARQEGTGRALRTFRIKPPATAKCPMWWNVLLEAGWERQNLAQADAIIWRESRCMSSAHNPDDPTKIGNLKGSIGLFQVNLFWVQKTTYYPNGYLQTMGVVTGPEDLWNPLLNARAALAIFDYSAERNGCGWNPWAKKC